MRSIWYLGTEGITFAFALSLLFVAPARAASPALFDEAAPVLARRCAGCHNPSEPKGELDLTSAAGLKKGGESGAAIDSANPAQGLLWERVSSGEMPPKKKLTARELEALERWIRAGAEWGPRAIDPFEYSTEDRAGLDWWSLQPVQEPVVPATTDDLRASARSPIDSFILTGLANHRMSPAPPAGALDLVRRTYLDLLGLPPTPDQVRDFVSDERPDAYERLVDRLLASPHFGERWARHWLDIIRFGESQGFERDKLRTNAWRYRDWVLDALNQDIPYDAFARSQLVGDLVSSGDPSALVATGFLVAGAYDEVGQSQQSAAMRAIVRQDEIEDLVAAVGQTFLGLTVNCSRCHDHKFDPVSQTEYYRLAAALGGVRHGEREVVPDPLAPVTVAALRQRANLLAEELAAIERPAREAILAERKKLGAKRPPRPVASWEFDEDVRDAAGSLHGKLHGNARLADGKLIVNADGYVVTEPLGFPLAEKTLEVLLQLADLDQRGGGAMSVQSLDGAIFDAIVFGENEPGRWMAGSNGFVRTKSFDGPVEKEASQQPVHLAITYQLDGTITGYRNGLAYGKAYSSSGLMRYKPGEAQIVFGMRHAPPGGNRMLKAGILRARLYDRALDAAEIAASAGVISDFVSSEELAKRLEPSQVERRGELRFELDQLQSQITRWNEGRIYAVTPKPPEATFVLKRGQTTQRGEEVAAGGLRALRFASADWGLAKDASDADRRQRLAEWLTDRHNPLFGRVIANRLWHYHFGVGIVETTNDFGFNGTRPSHPELLDWLTAALWRSDGHLKRLHREILVSATYRQSSRNRPEMLALDANNRRLWRKEPVRLDAEVIRDAMLAVAGDLNPQMHGPGFYDFTTFVHNTQFYEMQDPTGLTFHRRSIYRTWVRSGRSNFLDVFDCPDPSTKTPTRAVTTTPLQSLALLNSGFSLRMSEHLASRLRFAHPQDLTAQIQLAFQLMYGRDPEPSEAKSLARFVDQHRLEALCRVLWNSNEFLYSP